MHFKIFHIVSFPPVVCLLLSASCLLLSGCGQQTQGSLEKYAENAVTSVQKTTTATVEQTLQEAFQASQTGGATLRVKTALSVSSRLEGAQIDVELKGQNIILRGEVKNAKQKAIAQSIAVNTLDPKFKVVNRLAVPKNTSRKSPNDGKSRRAAA